MKNSLSYFFIRLLICLIVIMNFYGCSFINSDDNAIDSIDSNYISYDKGDKNSGILDTSKDGNGFYVTENFVKRYNSLVDKYGYLIDESLNRRNKVLYENAGVSKIKYNEYFIDNQHMQYFLILNTIKKESHGRSY